MGFNLAFKGLSQARTFEWFKHFKDGRESVEDRKHSGRLSTCTTPEMIAKVREVILKDRRQTIHNVGKFYYKVLRRMREKCEAQMCLNFPLSCQKNGD
jgi:hypothetical protein